VHAYDGLELIDTRVLASVRCAPPQNKPLPEEIATCSPWLERELTLTLPTVRVVVALGVIGWDAALRGLRSVGFVVPTPRPRFGHGATATLSSPSRTLDLLGCYHPSQQNTFTGRLTEPMLDDVLGRAASYRVEP
jgi:uracil-DNA glycosylase